MIMVFRYRCFRWNVCVISIMIIVNISLIALGLIIYYHWVGHMKFNDIFKLSAPEIAHTFWSQPQRPYKYFEFAMKINDPLPKFRKCKDLRFCYVRLKWKKTIWILIFLNRQNNNKVIIQIRLWRNISLFLCIAYWMRGFLVLKILC